MVLASVNPWSYLSRPPQSDLDIDLRDRGRQGEGAVLFKQSNQQHYGGENFRGWKTRQLRAQQGAGNFLALLNTPLDRRTRAPLINIFPLTLSLHRITLPFVVYCLPLQAKAQSHCWLVVGTLWHDKPKNDRWRGEINRPNSSRIIYWNWRLP